MTERPLIKLITEYFFTSDAFARLQANLTNGQDAVMAAPLSARALVVASVFEKLQKPTLVLIAGEEPAAQFTHELATWLGRDQVEQLPLYSFEPWRGQEPGPDVARQTAQRAQALEYLSQSAPSGTAPPAPRIVVASARALLRRLPNSAFKQQGISLVAGQELPPDCPYDQLALLFGSWGYQREDKVGAPGQFALRGDLLDIYPNDLNYALRIEFFGEEVERIRRVVVSTGQTIDHLEAVQIRPARELLIDAAAKKRALQALYAYKGEELELLPADYRHHLELIEQDQDFAERELYLPFFYPDSAGPLAALGADALVVAIEPRSLFDDAARYYEELRASLGRHIAVPKRAERLLAGLFVAPGELDFGRQQRLTVLGLIAASSGLDMRLEVKHPAIKGTPELLAENAAVLLKDGYLVAACIADHRLSQAQELALSDAHVSFTKGRLLPGAALLCGLALPTSLILPQAKLALLGLEDNSASAVARRARGRGAGGTGGAGGRTPKYTDPTDLSFPYKPGDYVVHEVFGIAYFRQFIRQEVVGVERDYLQLEYAEGDKLFIPVEQIDRITRYIGPAGRAPRLTRLNTSDWSRATQKARKSAKQLAFDLVDLYSRRAISRGLSYGPDNDMQYEMEQGFPYEETPDQLAAIADVKADMESAKPMDRLICGDVGFGKTEVALRAAFKAIQGGRQVMLLAPTTILAQQHYQTF
ncbi:MAG: DEAD/DEAH box helicase, partial [Coriobacteriia bacterium]|nr:DEAD/DEAH box helicase [Coriobacteriia bacterium]